MPIKPKHKMRDLTDQLFEAAYHPSLTHIYKNILKGRVKTRIRELTHEMNSMLPGDKLVKELEKRVISYVHPKYSSAFARDFALFKSGNCVVRAIIFLNALEYLGREDVKKNIVVKYIYAPDYSRESHLWLAYKGRNKTVEIFPDDKEKSDAEHSIESLIATAWSNTGILLEDAEKYEDAIGYYDRALEHDSSNASFWGNKGHALMNDGRHEDSIKCYDRALELDQKYANAWLNKGMALNELGKYEEAIVCFDKVLGINPHSPAALENKGTALDNLSRKDEAKECYGRAWNNRGVDLYKSGKFNDALECYDKSLEINPDSPVALANKSYALRELHRYGEAEECYKKAQGIKPLKMKGKAVARR